jgi:Uncharacterized conserved protein
MEQDRKKQQNIIKYGALGVWILLAVVILVNRNKITVDAIINYTPSNLVLAAFVLLLLFALKSLSIFFFSGILYTASGLMFDLPVALLVNSLGLVVMLSEGYVMGRYFGSDLVGTIAEKYPKIEAILHLEDRRPFLFTLLLRMMKLINFDLGSIYMGASRAKFAPYAVASFISAIPDLILYAVVGGGISSLSPSMVIVAGVVYVCITVASVLIIAYLVKHPEKIGG